MSSKVENGKNAHTERTKNYTLPKNKTRTQQRHHNTKIINLSKMPSPPKCMSVMRRDAKRNGQGYQRSNGRWEARYRPQTKVELAEDSLIATGFKGYRDGTYRYEFLE
jgi:hypothetical protein